MELWLAAIKVIEQDIIPVLSRDIGERLARGEWWIRAFEALNYRNYESLEWWAKDWAFHNDWGTSVFKEISPGIQGGQPRRRSLLRPVSESPSAAGMPAVSCGRTSAFTSRICTATPSCTVCCRLIRKRASSLSSIAARSTADAAARRFHPSGKASRASRTMSGTRHRPYPRYTKRYRW